MARGRDPKVRRADNVGRDGKTLEKLLAEEERSGAALFENFRETHAHEEQLRADSMALIERTHDLAKRLALIENALVLLFVYTHDHEAENDDELTVKMLGIRLFNTATSAIKLGLSGYYQQAFSLTRDIVETGFLVDFFRTAPQQIAIWKASSDADRRKKFSPVKIRIALDERDGNKEKKREKAYATLSEYASHATYRGFHVTMKEGMGQVGPFVDEVILRAWLEEMVLRLGPSATLYAAHFPRATNLESYLQYFSKQLLEGVQRDV